MKIYVIHHIWRGERLGSQLFEKGSKMVYKDEYNAKQEGKAVGHLLSYTCFFCVVSHLSCFGPPQPGHACPDGVHDL